MCDENCAKRGRCLKRKRKPNYTMDEQRLLLSIVKPYRHIIMATRNIGPVWEAKNRAWNNITKQFNAQTDSSVERNTGGLVALWKNIRRRMKDGRLKQFVERTDKVENDEQEISIKIEMNDQCESGNEINLNDTRDRLLSDVVLNKYEQLLDMKRALVQAKLRQFKVDVQLQREREQLTYDMQKKRQKKLFDLRVKRTRDIHELNLFKVKMRLGKW